MNLKIAILSGKGGTGKTFVSTNISYVLNDIGKKVTYLDCDVEAPNGHLFLKPDIYKIEDVKLLSPYEVDNEKCIKCGKCVKSCRFNAIALVKDKILFFKNLCHMCGACQLVCPVNAIIQKERKIGVLKHGRSENIDFYYGLLETGEGGMTKKLIKKLKEHVGNEITILDSPPGTSCPVVETVKNSDVSVLVTDPTPFGVNDLKLAVEMCRELDLEPVILINRAEYFNNELKEYCNKEKLEIVGEIPDDRRIAEFYSKGMLVANVISEYYSLFNEIAIKIIDKAKNKNINRVKVKKTEIINTIDKKNEDNKSPENKFNLKTKEIAIISGKGGTGKTSLTAAFCALEKRVAISDCDVDASDLYLVLSPEVKDKGTFSASSKASIDTSKCNLCGACFSICKFDAIGKHKFDDKIIYFIEEKFCEGCGVCSIVCKENAIEFTPTINGEWFASITRFGPLSHARLGIAEENSGKLVTFIRNKKNELAKKENIRILIIDGAPGTGCPVVASITGCDYAVIVTEPTVSGVHDLKRILDLIKFLNLRSGIVVNKYDLNIEKTEEIKKVAAEYFSDFLGIIPYDKSITEAQIKKISVVEYTENFTTAEIRKIWGKIKSYLKY